MKLGKVTSCVGDMAVVSPSDLGSPLAVDLARKLYNKPVNLDKQFVGKVFDVIGRVDSPLIVVRISSRFTDRTNLIGKIVHAK